MRLPQHCAGWVKDADDPVARVQRPPHEGMRPCRRVRWADPETTEGLWYCCDAHRYAEERSRDPWRWERPYANTFPVLRRPQLDRADLPGGIDVGLVKPAPREAFRDSLDLIDYFDVE